MNIWIESWLRDPVPLGTLLSITSGILLAVIGFVRTRMQDRKRYTLDVLMRYSHSAELLKALHAVTSHAARVKQGDDAAVDSSLEAQLAIVLPYFQSIALAASSGLLDRKIMLRARYGSMKSIWEAVQPYIARRRMELGRPHLYVELEHYLRDNAANYARYQQQVRERDDRRANASTRTPAW